MTQKRSVSSYRAIDLAMFAGMLAVCESIISWVSSGNRFGGQSYTASLAAAVTGIVYMRWGAWGAIHALVAALALCIPQKATSMQYIIYLTGNLFSLLALPLYKKLGRERIRTARFLFIPVSLSVLLLMQAGRAVVALIFGADLTGAVMFFTTDCLSAVFTVVITWIARQQNGLYEDQMHYLMRINSEEEQ